VAGGVMSAFSVALGRRKITAVVNAVISIKMSKMEYFFGIVFKA
jgi:hypothetical protein